ncbi:hypothetical protein HDU67_002725 [Dinochytrium kinnereticum]|nr:hypothetical protein HDU67_002725 [Dinochytrium kinnereticum]
MSTPSTLPGFVNADGTDVCISLSGSRVCDAWTGSTAFLDLSAMARGSANASESLVYDVNTFDAWVKGTSGVGKEGGRGYIGGLLRAGGCGDLKLQKAQAPALRYPKSFICSRAILFDSTPTSRETLRWNPETNVGGGCEANLLKRPPSLCAGPCQALMDSIVDVLADRQLCPTTDLSLLPLIKPGLYKICSEMVNGADTCVPAVSDEVGTCGFGAERISDAVQYCTRKTPTDSCCTSPLLTSAIASPPTQPSTTDPESGSSRTALAAGLITASLCLLVAAVAVAFFVGRRYGLGVRDVLSRLTCGWVAPAEDDEVLAVLGGARRRGRARLFKRGSSGGMAMVSRGEGGGASRSVMGGGGGRSGVPSAVWFGAGGTTEAEGLVWSDEGVDHGTGGSGKSLGMSRQGTSGSRSSRGSLGRNKESLGRASTRSNGTLVLKRGETFGPETFKTRWRGITVYIPRLPDEIEVHPGDFVTLSTFYK